MWVGLSAVRVSNIDHEEPLAANTNSGRLIHDIEKGLDDTLFYRTNLVKCLPLSNSKIRYPTSQEAQACFHNLLLEISILKPKFVFLLGKQVSDFVHKKNGIKPSNPKFFFDYQPIHFLGTQVISIHHPSYILIYKRSQVAGYAEAIQRVIG
ncbi:MAG: uracil-DNA glycosylase family protein [Gallionella sp.]|nr:uracil-DNA glycosylase family protein [Gallionella sp.]MDD4959300.1 uracil-DNA glycosylase family protein [Gallionella sp.]